MKKTASFLLAIIIALGMLCSCAKPVNNNIIQPVTPKQGETVHFANQDVQDWMKGDPQEVTQQYSGKGDQYVSEPYVLTWSCSEETAPKYYEFSISRNKDMSDADVYVCISPSVELKEYYTSTTYYWQVKAFYDDKTIISAVYSFKAAYEPRTLDIQGVSNTRDLVGKKGLGGKTIREGMIYRGANLDGIKAKGKTVFCDVLGIKTDLDLRAPGEGTAGNGKGSPAGESVQYINISAPMYSSILHEDNYEAFAQEIRLFADPANYPIYFHCAIGRDRTGTLGFIINALLGASKEDLLRDYSFSVFSYIASGDGTFWYELQGSILNLYDGINSNYKGKTFQKKVENYLLDIGITAEEIASIKSIMLE